MHRAAISLLFFADAALLVAGGTVLRATAPDPESLPPAETQAPALETFLLREQQVVPGIEVTGLLEP